MDPQNSENKLAQLTVPIEKIREYSNELHVTEDTPPTFITHAVDDDVVNIKNSILFIAALQANKVPVESYFYARGGHGYGMNNPKSELSWLDNCVDWLLRINKK